MIKGTPNGFPCTIASSMHAGCCQSFKKRKNHEPQASVFLHFVKVEQHPKCMDDAIPPPPPPLPQQKTKNKINLYGSIPLCGNTLHIKQI